ncbi:MAG: 4-hydroxy-3-methylbut-2-enyl diphosphate reductase, partial [Bacilli bacterium]
MEIKKISPQGFCQGVIKAIQTINKLLDDPSIVKPIYMYGSLVHNKHIIETYKDKGIIIVEDIENIHEGTIIITAHGVSDKVKETIKSRNLTLIDTTCKYVNKTHELIREKLISDYEVVFYGKR